MSSQLDDSENQHPRGTSIRSISIRLSPESGRSLTHTILTVPFFESVDGRRFRESGQILVRGFETEGLGDTFVLEKHSIIPFWIEETLEGGSKGDDQTGLESNLTFGGGGFHQEIILTEGLEIVKPRGLVR
jgi:hypothetical protein